MTPNIPTTTPEKEAIMPTPRTTPLVKTEPTVLDDILHLPHLPGTDEAMRNDIRHYAGGAIAKLAVGTAQRDYFGLNAKAIRRATTLALTEAAYDKIADGDTQRGDELMWAANVLAGVDGEDS
jgi:hypothetical protein